MSMIPGYDFYFFYRKQLLNQGTLTLKRVVVTFPFSSISLPRAATVLTRCEISSFTRSSVTMPTKIQSLDVPYSGPAEESVLRLLAWNEYSRFQIPRNSERRQYVPEEKLMLVSCSCNFFMSSQFIFSTSWSCLSSNTSANHWGLYLKSDAQPLVSKYTFYLFA